MFPPTAGEVWPAERHRGGKIEQLHDLGAIVWIFLKIVPYPFWISLDIVWLFLRFTVVPFIKMTLIIFRRKNGSLNQIESVVLPIPSGLERFIVILLLGQNPWKETRRSEVTWKAPGFTGEVWHHGKRLRPWISWHVIKCLMTLAWSLPGNATKPQQL